MDNEFIKSQEQIQWLFDNEQSNPMLSQLYINYLIKTNIKDLLDGKKFKLCIYNFFASVTLFVFIK